MVHIKVFLAQMVKHRLRGFVNKNLIISIEYLRLNLCLLFVAIVLLYSKRRVV